MAYNPQLGPIQKEKRGEFIGFRLSTEDRQLLIQLAKEADREVSDYIRKLIRDECKRVGIL